MPTYNITEVNINQEDSNGRVEIVEQPLISDVTLSVLGSEAEVNIAETTQISDVNILQESGESEVNFVEVPQITNINIIMAVQEGAPAVITESFYTTTNLGGFDANELVPQGMTFTQFAMKLLVEIFYPTYVAPSFSLGSNQSGYVEVGTTLSVTLTGNLNRGSILGNIVLGVWSPSAFQNFRAGSAISYILESNFQLSNTRTFSYVVLFGTNSFSGSVTYAQGSQPLDSTGANYQSPLPSGTLSGNNTGLYGLYRQFYGNVVNHPVNSAQVRALESSNFENVNSFSATISSTKFTIAIRATKTLVSAITANNENITSSFILNTFTVNDAAGNPINYNIYNFESALPLGLLTNFVLA
jgi:hypothetical protein